VAPAAGARAHEAHSLTPPPPHIGPLSCIGTVPINMHYNFPFPLPPAWWCPVWKYTSASTFASVQINSPFPCVSWFTAVARIQSGNLVQLKEFLGNLTVFQSFLSSPLLRLELAVSSANSGLLYVCESACACRR